MWYGLNKTTNLDRRMRNKKHRWHLRDRKLGKVLLKRNTNVQLSSLIHVPLGWKFILLSTPLLESPVSKQSILYAYRNNYFLNFTLPPFITQKSYDSQTRTFILVHPHTSYCYGYYLRSLNDLFSRFLKPYFLKIRFQGKGYYIYKNKRNTIAPQFGYAHRVYVYAQALSVMFLSKTKILLFGLSRSDILETSYRIKLVKPINIFTGRGVRFARQIIYRKTGKVSSYR